MTGTANVAPKPDDGASEQARTRILEAAAAVIVRKGIDGASLRLVAKEADVSLGLLSYHFDDKQTLLRQTFQRATDVLLDRSLAETNRTDVALSAEAKVEAYIRGAFHEDFLRPDYLHLRITLWAMARTDPIIGAVERDLYMRYANHLAVTIREARPRLEAAQVERRATDVIVTQNGLWLNWARYQNRDDLERGLGRCVALALGG